MDQFGVLVESIGFKSQGKSTPIADLKGKTGMNNGFPQNLGTNKPQVNTNSFDTSFIVDDLDGIFRSSSDRNQATSAAFDDLFGVPTSNPKQFDLDSVFNGTSNLGVKPSNGFDDIFGGLTGSKSSTSVYDDGVFANFGSVPKKSESVDDLFGGFNGIGLKSNGLKKNASSSDNFSSGFRLRPPPNGKIQMRNEKESNVQRPMERPQRRNEPRKEEAKVDLDSFFGMDARQAPSRPSNEDSMFDKLFPSRDPPKVERTSSWTPSEPKKNSPVTDIADDFSFFFEMGGGQPSGNFQEIEGESEDRRKARLKHHQKTQERMAKALNEKTQRDLKTQREQEERHRLSDSLDDSIKRWATGKEGNLRALLSSLQHVLWPECGWHPVSLTDLITSTSVKKIYYKATLCVHPDKVQQKGANLQQKFIAEKVFDLLKEAWTKFNKEEL